MDNRALKINDRTLLIWNDNIGEINKEMINNIDCDFFDFQSQYVEKIIEQEEITEVSRKVLVNILGHTLESFFAILFSSIQSPDFYFGWISNYNVSDIGALIDKVNNGESVFNKIGLSVLSWESIALKLFPVGFEKVSATFAGLWKELADEYKGVLTVYNSLKHGFRLKTDGIKKLTLGSLEINNEEFEKGFMVYRLDKIDDNKTNHSIYKTFYHFNVQKLALYIQAASISINNLKGFLTRYNSIHQDDLLFHFPSDEWISNFEKVKSPRIKGVKKISLPTEYLTPLPTKVEIDESLKQKYERK